MNKATIEHPEHLMAIKNGYLLRTGVLYGANAAGKSNFLRALARLRLFVIESSSYKLDDSIMVYQPYKLDANYQNQPTIFEIDFIAKDKKRYVYEVHFNEAQVLKEILYFYANDKEVQRKALLYARYAGKNITFGDYYRGKREFFLNDNQLLLSKAGIEAIPILSEAYRFISKSLHYVPAQSNFFDEAALKYVEQFFAKEAHLPYKTAILSIIKAADTGISDIYFKKRIRTVHKVFDKTVQVDESIFDLEEESEGTQKLLSLAAMMVDNLYKGGVLIIDELNKHLHPLLTRMLIQLFHQDMTNPNNAQLLFSTHDVSLIDRNLFRRDQIYMIDKTLTGASRIGRLSDFKDISKVIPLDKWYMRGLFRGTPAINDYEIDINFENHWIPD